MKKIFLIILTHTNVNVIDACMKLLVHYTFIFPPKLINNNNYIDAFAVNNCPVIYLKMI